MSKTSGRVNSIEVIRNIFNVFALQQKPCTVKEIEQITGLSSSTLYKFLKELQKINFLSYGSDKKYFIGDKISVYGELYNYGNPHLQAIKSLANTIAEETGLTAQVCTLVQGKYMVLHESIPNSPHALQSLILGRNVPVTWTASGRLLLDAQSKEELWSQLGEDDLTLPNGDTILLTDLFEEVSQAHKNNYAEFKSPINDCTCLASVILNKEAVRYTLCLSIKQEDLPQLRNNAAETLLRYTRNFSI